MCWVGVQCIFNVYSHCHMVFPKRLEHSTFLLTVCSSLFLGPDQQVLWVSEEQSDGLMGEHLFEWFFTIWSCSYFQLLVRILCLFSLLGFVFFISINPTQHIFCRFVFYIVIHMCTHTECVCFLPLPFVRIISILSTNTHLPHHF